MQGAFARKEQEKQDGPEQADKHGITLFDLPFPPPGCDPALSVQFSSVTQLSLTLCDPMNRSTPGLPVRHQLPEFTQTHAHQVSDAILPSHPLLSPSPPAPSPSQHQGFFPMSQLFT